MSTVGGPVWSHCESRRRQYDARTSWGALQGGGVEVAGAWRPRHQGTCHQVRANCSVKPYEGNEPFLFVSYAHKDDAIVYPIIELLAGLGYRVWYDEGITFGQEWAAEIATHLRRAIICIFAISSNSLGSKYVKDEIHFAYTKDVPIYSIFLENVDLDPALELRLGRFQYLHLVQIGHGEPLRAGIETELAKVRLLRTVL